MGTLFLPYTHTHTHTHTHTQKSLSRVRLFATPWIVAHQASRSMGFSRHEYWSGLLFPSPLKSATARYLNVCQEYTGFFLTIFVKIAYLFKNDTKTAEVKRKQMPLVAHDPTPTPNLPR